jgi:hypothetical protein
MRDPFEQAALDGFLGGTYGANRRLRVVFPVEAGAESDASDTLLDESSFGEDCALMAQHARSFLGQEVEIIRLDRGKPGHNTTFLCSAPFPVAYSTAAFHHLMYLADSIFRYHTNRNQSELADQLPRAFNRILAEYLLYKGDIDASLRYMTMSKSLPIWASFFEQMEQDSLRGEHPGNRRDAYIPLAYHGLAHEIGHHVNGDRLRSIERMRACRRRYIRSTMKQVVGKITNALDAAGELGIAGSIFVEMVMERNVDEIRKEIIADIASVELLWLFHCDSNSKRGLPRPRYEVFISHVIISLVCLWEGVLIGSLADVDPSRLQQATPADLDKTLISNVGVMIRIGAIMDTFLRGRWYLWRSGMVPFTRFRSTMRAAMPLIESTGVVLQLFQKLHPMQFRLRISNPEDTLRNYVRDFILENGLIDSPDSDLQAFVRLAGELGLRSSEYDALEAWCAAHDSPAQ